MEKVKKLLMQQMELLHEQAKKTESADDLATLTRGMIGLSAEMRESWPTAILPEREAPFCKSHSQKPQVRS